ETLPPVVRLAALPRGGRRAVPDDGQGPALHAGGPGGPFAQAARGEPKSPPGIYGGNAAHPRPAAKGSRAQDPVGMKRPSLSQQQHKESAGVTLWNSYCPTFRFSSPSWSSLSSCFWGM